METKERESGISVVGKIAWGTHFCHFYQTKDDLLDVLIPYFKTGLENNEFCLWVVSDPLGEAEARIALRQAVPEAARYLATGHIEILPHTSFLSSHQENSATGRIEIVPSTEWYLKDGALVPERVIKGWNEKLAQALASGYAGMRVNANESWLTQENWNDFAQYERALDETLGNRRMIVLCSYPLSGASAAEILDVARTHEFVIARRQGKWEIFESPALVQAKADLKRLNEELGQRVVERTRELAVTNEELRAEISERKRAEDALRAKERDLAEAQRVAKIGSWRFDQSTSSITWSDELYRIFEIAKSDLITYESFLNRVHPEDKKLVLQVNALARRDGKQFDFTYRIIVPSGAVRVIHEVGYTTQDEQGNVKLLFGVAQDITEREQLEDERDEFFKGVQEARDHLRVLSQHLIQVQEQERRAIARELHDEIGQQLTALKINLQAAQAATQTPETKFHHEESTRILERVIQQVRSLSLDLRPSMLDDLGLVPALRWYIDRQAQLGGFIARFSPEAMELPIPPDVQTAAFRFAQEALTNVIKHAQAKHVSVELRQRSSTEGNGALELVVRDDGRGFDSTAAFENAAHGESMGLLNMRERAQLLGGQFEIVSSPKSGTVVRATFSLKGDSA